MTSKDLFVCCWYYSEFAFLRGDFLLPWFIANRGLNVSGAKGQCMMSKLSRSLTKPWDFEIKIMFKKVYLARDGFRLLSRIDVMLISKYLILFDLIRRAVCRRHIMSSKSYRKNSHHQTLEVKIIFFSHENWWVSHLNFMKM